VGQFLRFSIDFFTFSQTICCLFETTKQRHHRKLRFFKVATTFVTKAGPNSGAWHSGAWTTTTRVGVEPMSKRS